MICNWCGTAADLIALARLTVGLAGDVDQLNTVPKGTVDDTWLAPVAALAVDMHARCVTLGNCDCQHVLGTVPAVTAPGFNYLMAGDVTGPEPWMRFTEAVERDVRLEPFNELLGDHLTRSGR